MPSPSDALAAQLCAFAACVAAAHVVIVQAANTGLTGGSTPDGDYGRPVVVINTLRIDGVIPIRGGSEVVCLSGATLYELERVLAPLGREPHSVIGSSRIGASVVGGVCNNSGGALVQRGPAYTEHALNARVDTAGQVQLHNHLGIALGDDSEAMLAAIDEASPPRGSTPTRPSCSRRLPALFRLKDRIARRLPFVPKSLADRLLQGGARLFPDHLPLRMRAWRDRYEHDLILKAADEAIGPIRDL